VEVEVSDRNPALIHARCHIYRAIWAAKDQYRLSDAEVLEVLDGIRRTEVETRADKDRANEAARRRRKAKKAG
jgi:hypothetical protein